MTWQAPKRWRWMPGMRTLPFRDEYGEESYPPWRVTDVGHKWPWSFADCDALPDLDDPATLGCIEHGLLPDEWSAELGRPVEIEVVPTHRFDPDTDRLGLAYVARVMVWADTWREHWVSEPRATKGDALMACVEALS